MTYLPVPRTTPAHPDGQLPTSLTAQFPFPPPGRCFPCHAVDRPAVFPFLTAPTLETAPPGTGPHPTPACGVSAIAGCRRQTQPHTTTPPACLPHATTGQPTGRPWRGGRQRPGMPGPPPGVRGATFAPASLPFTDIPHHCPRHLPGKDCVPKHAYLPSLYESCYHYRDLDPLHLLHAHRQGPETCHLPQTPVVGPSTPFSAS